jgi:phosphopantothenoylcysteine decarboxylase/phosphopantothenate--cysteine ligase
MLKGRQIVIGITGGIAAYKIPLLVREFVRRGASVRVLMTEAAAKFVTPLTLSTLSGSETIVGTFPSPGSGHAGKTWHIDLARGNDLMVIAPATANVVAKLAGGIADDAVTTLALAFRKAILVCPAMDFDMWENPATRRNAALLREMGYDILPPDEGELASGLTGPGRLPEVERIAAAAEAIVSGSGRDLDGRRILVTAGPTHEAIDPVRFIGNRSSGKMGFAIALAAARRGADVTLVAGPVGLATPRGVRRVDVESAAEMHREVMKRSGKQDAVVMAAAVADFTPATVSAQKIKKSAAGKDGVLRLELRPTKDILLSLTQSKARPAVAGFALETLDETRNALRKLKEKKPDLLVLNNPSKEGSSFGGDTNAVTFFWKSGRSEKLRLLPKFDVANALLDRLKPMLPKVRTARPRGPVKPER